MSDASATPAPADEIFIRLVKELEATDEALAVIERYCELHPHLAEELRGLGRARRMLDLASVVDGARPPEHLGDFHVVRQIARGGMGAIYEAVQEPLGRRVAVKTIRSDGRHLSPHAQARFLREQEILARLHHTHIVPIHASGQVGELQYFAMPYIEGLALHDLVRSVRRRESSKPGSETPSLAELAGEATPGDHHDGHASTETFPHARNDLPAPTPTPPASVLRLSSKYLRSVSKVIASAADALDHAHQVQIIHRDLKPSNLMVDKAEHCWVLDFGLAGYLTDGHGGGARPGGPKADGQPVLASGVMGTPHYMAPEQFDGHADERSDIWGLGVTLYELLTLRRAFDSREQICTADPPKPRSLVGNLPRDLEAICLKAIEKAPSRRYQTAHELGNDLRRWLAWKPVRVRPGWKTLRPVRLWAWRNKGWAAAIAAVTLLMVGIAVGGVVVAAAAAERERDLRREMLVQEVQRERMAKHKLGWSREVWNRIGEIGRRIPDGHPARGRLQQEAVASLAGLDAVPIKHFEEFGARFVAFNPTGTKLLFGGLTDPKNDAIPLGAKLWNDDTQRLDDLKIIGQGPVGFRPDGTPIQLIVDRKANTLTLMDLARGEPIHRFTLPGVLATDDDSSAAMLPDGSRLAAPMRPKEGPPLIVVWDGQSGAELRRFEAPAHGLAISPDQALLAAGDASGHIRVWSLATGERLALLKNKHTRVHCLAFGRDPRRPLRAGADWLGRGWLLAAGHADTTVTVWDLASKAPSIALRGASAYDVYALSFSPDGSLLATTGRWKTHLWDLATGEHLLQIPCTAYVYGLAFSPNGQRLAIAGNAAHGVPGRGELLGLEEGRGIRTYRGLSGSSARGADYLVTSPDERLVAMLSTEWRVAIWERATGLLRLVIDVPPGMYSDNAAIAFSPDGRRLAFAGGHEARLYDAENGQVLMKPWIFPEGLLDNLVFQGPDRLLSIRLETKTGDARPDEHPRVVRIRDLLGRDPLVPVRELAEFNRGARRIEIGPDGATFVVEGFANDPNDAGPLNGFDTSTFESLWQAPPSPDQGWGYVLHQGVLIGRFYTGCVLIDARSGRRLKDFSAQAARVGFDDISPDARQWFGQIYDTEDFGLFEQGRDRPLFTIHPPSAGFELNRFRPDGLQLVGARANGFVICDLKAIQRRLAKVGLGW